VGVDPKTLGGVLLTHEHSDHISGIPVLSRRLGIPTFASPATAEVRKWGRRGLKDEVGVKVMPVASGEGFAIDELTVTPFSVSHDAADPMMYLFEFDGRRIGFATDLGMVTRLVRERLRGVDALVIESNHDPAMLENGPYRPEDKARIKSRLGHLSNEEAQEFVREIAHEGLRHVTLAHLSKINNAPDIAYAGMRRVLDETAPACGLSLALQDVIGDVVRVTMQEAVA
jgi:phosphoribosyl 1,2-cyclic phosphodiesterase